MDDPERSTLLLRLGIAVNATRSAHRFFVAVKDSPGPAGERDRFWAFLVALGFLHEAILTLLTPKFPQIRDLARAGGADEKLLKEAGELLSGKHPLRRSLTRMRNQLIFHWDEKLIRQFIQGYDKDTVAWADGTADMQGEMIYRVAADALSNSVLFHEPGTPQPEPSDRGMEPFQDLLGEVLPAMNLVFRLFDFAMMGHILGIRVKTVWS